jgi:hypothetical protein
LVIFNYNSFNSCFSDKLGNLTVALGVAGAGIFALQNRFICRVSYHVWRFYNTGDRVQLGIKGDVDIGVELP